MCRRCYRRSRPLTAPGRTWFLLADALLALADRWLARREHRRT